MPEDPEAQSKATRAGLGVVGIPSRFGERAQTHPVFPDLQFFLPPALEAPLGATVTTVSGVPVRRPHGPSVPSPPTCGQAWATAEEGSWVKNAH